MTATAARQETPGDAGSVDGDQVARFGVLSRDWWNPAGRMQALHRINPVRIRYIRDLLCARSGSSPEQPSPLGGVAVLDVGCGAGLLAEPLARLGAKVTGIDASPEMIEVARAHAAGMNTPVDYRATRPEELAASGASFDAVLVMEVVEHVADVGILMVSCCALVRPGGLLIAATLNRTVRSFVLAIAAAEYVLGWTPRGTHDWRRFVRPSELSRHLRAGGMTVTDITGVSYSPLAREWRASRDPGINYVMAAEKPAEPATPAATPTP